MSAGSFNIYRSLYRELRGIHPQRCEFDADEYAKALAHPATVTAPIHVGSGRADAPQLVSTRVSHWLNAGFYEDRFSLANSTERHLHLTLWPGQPIGDRVRHRLTELSRDSGVIALDGPAAGEWSVDEALRRLYAELPEFRFGEPELLGTQTYWAGPLESSSVITAAEPISPSEAADRLSLSIQPGDRATGAFLREELTEEEADSMYGLYEAAYSVLSEHPCAQGVTPPEFRKMMLHQPDMEKLVFQRHGEVESICLITPNLSSLGWINLEFYKRRFGEPLERGRVHWYPAIATDPGHSGARNAEHLVTLIGQLYEAACNPATILFDTPDLNTAFLPAYLTELINALPRFSVQFEVIGKHRYYAVPLGE